MALQEFDESVADAIAELDARTIINAFTRTLKDLGELSIRRDRAAEEWLAQRRGRLVSPTDASGPEDAET